MGQAMKPMRILFDGDGVLVDFLSGALAIVQDLTGESVLEHQVCDYDLGLLLPEDLRAEFWRRCAAPGFCAGLEPYPHAHTVVQLLRRNHIVGCVTAPMRDSPTWKAERSTWLQRRLGIAEERIWLVPSLAKVEIDGDIFVDDNPALVEHWQLAHPESTALLWERPYNRRSGYCGASVTSWVDFLDTLRLLEKRRA